MRTVVPLAWLQLVREKARLAAALAGIAFAVILMLMQLGFKDALFSSASVLHDHLKADLVMLSPQYEFLIHPKGFSERRLYQALGVDGVRSVASIYLAQAAMKNPDTRRDRRIFLIGFNPEDDVLDLPGLDANMGRIRDTDVVLFDEKSRPEYGEIPAEVRRNGTVRTEVAGRLVTIGGTFVLGASFGSDGNLITSDLNLLRLQPGRPAGVINMGLIRVKRGVDPETIRNQLVSTLPRDVRVLTRKEYSGLEKDYWGSETPIGFVFNLGLLMGMIVGCVIVYQILFTDVSDHLAEYATLKAMGYRDKFLFHLLLQQALILSIAGFLPGLAIAEILYVIARRATLLPLNMTIERIAGVYLLTAVMCTASGVLVLRKLRLADPAEIF
jgi:putative ABC transport system permease protein